MTKTDISAALWEVAEASRRRADADMHAEAARQEQHAALLAAHEAGASVYKIAQASGLSQSGVAKILARMPEKNPDFTQPGVVF